ncbi:MAG: hypothetical protein ACN6OV_09495 [Acinetobacter sp.]|uniref:hypothetical protein n=1 Tax=Acinetobacter sp. TaxID=472 RepID=UPI003CFBDA34
MQNKIVFLDDNPSLLDSEINLHFRDNIKNLLDLFKYFKDRNIQIQMNCSIHDLKISENINFRQIKKELKSEIREELQSLKLILSKYPYSTNFLEQKNIYLGNLEVLYNSNYFESLSWAYILETMVISFKKNLVQWNSNSIIADLICINESLQDIEEQQISIKHANTIEHLIEYDRWLNESGSLPNIEEFLTEPSEFLPNLTLLNEAEEGIRKHYWLFSTIYSKLYTINNYIEDWKNKDGEPFVPPINYAAGEHDKRKSQFPKRLEGYEAHLYFTGIEGRIHYKLENKTLVIAYIGEKLLI